MSKTSKRIIGELADRLDSLESRVRRNNNNRSSSNSNSNSSSSISSSSSIHKEEYQEYQGAEWEDEWAAELAADGFTKEMLSGRSQANPSQYSEQLWNLFGSFNENRRNRIQQQLHERLTNSREECEKFKQELIAESEEMREGGGTMLEWEELEFKKKLLNQYLSRLTTPRPTTTTGVAAGG